MNWLNISSELSESSAVCKAFEKRLTIDLDTIQFAIALSKDGHTLITGGMDRQIRVWNTETGQLLRSWLATEPSGNRDIDRVNYLSLSEDESILVSAGSLTQVWNFQSAEELQRLKRYGWSLYCNLSPDSEVLITHDFGSLTIWDWKKKKRIRSRSDGNFLANLIITQDNEYLIGETDSEGAIRISDLKSGRYNIEMESDILLKINYLSCSQNRQLIAGSGREGILVWDISTGRKIQTIKKFGNARFHKHLDSVNRISFGFKDEMLFSAGDDNKIQIWHIKTGENLGCIIPHFRLNDFRLSHDYKIVVTHSVHDKKVEIWRNKHL